MSAFRPDGWTTPELAQAVERGQLELHYQPVVDLRSGGIVGAGKFRPLRPLQPA